MATIINRSGGVKHSPTQVVGEAVDMKLFMWEPGPTLEPAEEEEATLEGLAQIFGGLRRG